jgi:hypothetical protein
MHIAQLNIGRLVADREDAQVAEFMAALDPVNAIAEASPGFVWRLQTDEGNATSIRPFDDDRILVNMSVWESIEAVQAFAYASRHVEYLRRRREWFERMGAPTMVLWWVTEGHIPTTEEAKARLEHLERHGPTPTAFTFKQAFPPDAEQPLATTLSRSAQG